MSETEQVKEKPSLRERLLRSTLEWIETIVMAIVLVSVVFTFFLRVITVDGGSMKPTYHNGDRVLVSDLGREIQRGDVVIIVNALKQPIIKRVIATAGETVDFDAELGEVVVNGTPVYGQEFGVENGITTMPLRDDVLSFPQTVPEGCVFVLGDNRGNSTDSRFTDVGMVDLRNVLGRVVFNLYPLSQAGVVK